MARGEVITHPSPTLVCWQCETSHQARKDTLIHRKTSSSRHVTHTHSPDDDDNIYHILFVPGPATWRRLGLPKKRGRSSLDNVERLNGQLLYKNPLHRSLPSLRKALSPFPPSPPPCNDRRLFRSVNGGGGSIFCADASLCSFFFCQRKSRTPGMHQMSCRHPPLSSPARHRHKAREPWQVYCQRKKASKKATLTSQIKSHSGPSLSMHSQVGRTTDRSVVGRRRGRAKGSLSAHELLRRQLGKTYY